MWTKVQQTTKWIATVLSIVAVILLTGAWTEHAKNEHQKSREDDIELRCDLNTEREERGTEYMQLQTKLSTLEIQMQELSTGQDWIIMRMKGDI